MAFTKAFFTFLSILVPLSSNLSLSCSSFLPGIKDQLIVSCFIKKLGFLSSPILNEGISAGGCIERTIPPPTMTP